MVRILGYLLKNGDRINGVFHLYLYNGIYWVILTFDPNILGHPISWLAEAVGTVLWTPRILKHMRKSSNWIPFPIRHLGYKK